MCLFDLPFADDKTDARMGFRVLAIEYRVETAEQTKSFLKDMAEFSLCFES